MRQFIVLGAVALLAGCAATQPPAPADTMTLGAVQRSVHKGMTQSEIVNALGAPNMVTRDKDGTETWVYDKASTSFTSAHTDAYGTVLLMGVSGGQSSASTSQRTLTLIIKFKDAVVSDFTYRSTSF
jgi:outer membrane protein assembly factor BamE (lipoprotein component of BamABCDE complex)